MKRHDTPPPRSLILRDAEADDTVLRVTGSNRAPPYRETLLLTFEDEVRGYGLGRHLATTELDPDEEEALRAMLNARAAARLRVPSGFTSEPRRELLIWDMDRIMVTDVTEGNAFERLAEIAQRSPYNTFHLLGSLATAKGGDIRAPSAWNDVGDETPRNLRLIVEGTHAAGHDETAMAWFDRADERWYYAPQGGVIPWTVKRWQYLPATSEGSATPTKPDDDIEDEEDRAAVGEFRRKLRRGEEELIPAEIVDKLLSRESRIETWREHRGLSRADLATKAGVMVADIAAFEQGERSPQLRTFGRLAAALNVSIEDLL